MVETVLFVDLENIHKIELARIPEQSRVELFYGSQQVKRAMAIAACAEPLNTRLEVIQIVSEGRNALDFHIAFRLGRELTIRPHSCCRVLSGDKGFDPLLTYLRGEGHNCRRVIDLLEWLPVLSDRAKRVVHQLAKIEPIMRPRKRPALGRHINSRFGNGLQPAEVDSLVCEIFDKGLVSESGNALIYSF